MLLWIKFKIGIWSQYRVSFASTGLTVSKDCSIVSFQAAFCDGFGYACEHFVLGYLLATNEIEGEEFRHIVNLSEKYQRALLDAHAFFLALLSLLFPFIKRPDPDTNFKAILMILKNGCEMLEVWNDELAGKTRQVRVIDL